MIIKRLLVSPKSTAYCTRLAPESQHCAAAHPPCTGHRPAPSGSVHVQARRQRSTTLRAPFAHIKQWIWVSLLLASMGACVEPAGLSGPPSQLEAPVTKAPQPNAVESTHEQLAETPLVAPQSRPPRRMNVKQLSSAIDRIFGFAWTQTEDGVVKDMMVELSLAFGQPNYLDVTQEDLNISPLFLKFLNDGARVLCLARVAIDLADQEMVEKTLIVGVGAEDNFETEAAKMETALKRLLLMFWGRRVQGDELLRWQSLFEEAAVAGGSSEMGWRTVCVAAMTHPHFYSY